MLLSNEMLSNVRAIMRSELDRMGKIRAIQKLHLLSYNVTKESGVYMLQVIYTLRSVDDYGKEGKLFEAQCRLLTALAHGTSITVQDLYARPQGTPDMRIKLHNGKYVTVECKTGRGDWYATIYHDRERAYKQYRNSKKWIIWKNKYFTIVCPIYELCDYLETYSGGWATFFEKDCKPSQRGYILKLQNFTTSKRKIKFLQEFAKTTYSLKHLLINRELIRR